MALPGGAVAHTLNFGAYADPAFVGMKGILRLSHPLTHIATGDVVQQTWTFVIGNDGTATVSGLPANDDPAFAPTGTSYSLEWQVLAWKDSPGNKSFVLPLAGPTTVDFDLLASVDGTQTGTFALPLVTSVNGHAGAVKDSDLGIGASFVVHGTNASVARPTTAMPVIWYGSVNPVHADDALDVWIPVSADGGADSLASLQAALAAKADLAAGVVPDSELPARLQDAALRAALGAADPVLSNFSYDATTGNLLSYQEDGITITLTYNADGTVATSKRGTAAAKAYTYSGGNLSGVA